jgi:broad specificity phosphatase PhoE
MGKPRLIILIRHAQSEGNKNKAIHQKVPDHRVPLTTEGQEQALNCGRSLRKLLRPDDTIHFFTSPYRRTRETTEGIISSLTSDDPSPSPFPRRTIKVYEEPRLREQDFGNFQPGEQEMAMMWKQRAEYGHFFYRIPNGESAADAYDRVSGFNDSLWRRFEEPDFASVCILVTHGLMTRVFLMKWYHFSVEYFEDLRNVGHCEMTVLKRSETGKFVLQNELRTWSELRRERAARGSVSAGSPDQPIPTRRKWGGCHEKCNDPHHDHSARKRLPKRQNTADLFKDDIELLGMSPQKTRSSSSLSKEQDQTPSQEGPSTPSRVIERDFGTEAVSEKVSTSWKNSSLSSRKGLNTRDRSLSYGGRDGGGSRSGAASPFSSSDDEEAFPEPTKVKAGSIQLASSASSRSLAQALRGELIDMRGPPGRAMADSLGDQSDAETEDAEVEMGDKERERQELAAIIEDERKDRSISGSAF